MTRKRSAKTWKRLTDDADNARATFLKAQELLFRHREHDLDILEVEQYALNGSLPKWIDAETLRFKQPPMDMEAALGIAIPPEIKNADRVYADALERYLKAYGKRFNAQMEQPDVLHP